MKNAKLLGAILVATLIGIGIGYLSHEGINSILGKTQLVKPTISLDTMKGSIMYSRPPGLTPNAQLNTAHAYSVNFRNAAGYCNNITTNGKVLLDTASIGFTELKIEHAIDLLAAMWDIKHSAPAVNIESYRIINGKTTNDNNGIGTLIVVPLVRRVAGNPLQELPINNNQSLLRILDYKIDCPIKCDCSGSAVIVGDPARQQSSCR